MKYFRTMRIILLVQFTEHAREIQYDTVEICVARILVYCILALRVMCSEVVERMSNTEAALSVCSITSTPPHDHTRDTQLTGHPATTAPTVVKSTCTDQSKESGMSYL